MINVNVNEVKTHLSSCLAKVAQGETVVICKRNKPVAEIRPISTVVRKKRPIGLAKKEYPGFVVDQAFFDPLPAELVNGFSGESK